MAKFAFAFAQKEAVGLLPWGFQTSGTVKAFHSVAACGCREHPEISFLGIFAELLDNVGERHLCRVFQLRERLASSAMGACKTLATRPYSLPLRRTFALEFPRPMSSDLPSIPRTRN